MSLHTGDHHFFTPGRLDRRQNFRCQRRKLDLLENAQEILHLAEQGLDWHDGRAQTLGVLFCCQNRDTQGLRSLDQDACFFQDRFVMGNSRG